MLHLRTDAAAHEPTFKLTIPGAFEARPISSEHEVREAIQAHMKSLEESGVGIKFDTPIEVEIRSAGVLNMDLVDLPGLLQVDKYGEKLAADTEKCTEQYLRDPQTGAVICVIDARVDTLRTSRAVAMLQKHTADREELRKHTIGVFARIDQAKDPDWEDYVDDEGEGESPLWKLERRVRALAGAHAGGGPAHEDAAVFEFLQGGCVALKNRTTAYRPAVALEDADADELNWFWMQTTRYPEIIAA